MKRATAPLTPGLEAAAQAAASVPLLAWLAVAIGALLVALVGTGLVRRFAPLDLPNARSSHAEPTPRGGGLAIGAALLLSWFGLAAFDLLPIRLFLALVAGGAPLAAVAWLDDRRPGGVPPKVRFLVQGVAVGLALLLLGGLPRLDFGAFAIPLNPMGMAIFVAVPMVWLVNLFNFMDGTDGLAGVEAATVAGFATALFLLVGDPPLALCSLAVAAAALGFLPWNWAPARIFLGDVGSCLLGYTFAVLAVAGEARDGVPAMLWTVVLGVFFWDATLTLLRRWRAGEDWTAAHRSHAYQRAARLWGSHARVAGGTLLINLLILGPLTLVAALEHRAILPVVWIAFALLLFLWHGIHALDERRRQDGGQHQRPPGDRA
jgi:Fuc2NAc and GlcNAc transferase